MKKQLPVRISLALLAGGAACLSLAAHPAPAAAPRKPNIVLILADDLGYGDLGCFGQKEIRTPNLDRMAAQGTRFTNFYAGCTVCAPSRCALMTGLHTGHTRIRGNAHVDLRPEDRTVAELLKGAGYTTGLVGKWGLGQEGSAGVPTRKGFDSFFGYLDQAHAHNYYPTFLLRNEQRVALPNVVPNEGPFGQGVASVRKVYSDDLFTQEALQFIDRNREKPFFLYLAYTIPHANDEAKGKGMEVPDYGPYADRPWPEPQKGLAAMITRMDSDIGRIGERLKSAGIDEKTMVIFASDNGPHQEGGNNPQYFHSSGGLRGIKRDAYEGGIRVPAIVRWPGTTPADRTCRWAGYFPDFLPTAAELAGVPVPKGLDGISFLPTILGHEEQQRQHDYLYWEFYERGGSRAVRMGKWKGVCQPWHSPLQLFDLDADSAEQHNLAAGHRDEVARIQSIMDHAHADSPEFPIPPARAGAKLQ